MKKSALPILLVILLLPSLCHALTGKVISVADGDTITILDSGKRQHKIRLYGFDCPEKGQPFGKAAKKFTSRLTYKKTATVTEYDTDRYGRTVGVVKVGGVNVNEEIIRAGYATHSCGMGGTLSHFDTAIPLNFIWFQGNTYEEELVF